jgi:ribosomal protein S18 acetylase RimI-like enzyme
MVDATDYARQWAGLVANVRLFGAHAPRGRVIEIGPMVASLIPSAPESSVMNVAMAVESRDTPERLEELADAFREGGANKWGLWARPEDSEGARAAERQGMVLDSLPAAMVADLGELPFDEAAACQQPDFATVGRINDLAYGYDPPKLAPAIGRLPDRVRTYGASHDGAIGCVAMAYDVGTDTAVWFVATLPQARRRGLASEVLKRLLLDARARGQRTASLQASQAGRPLYERLGFAGVGTLHLYEQRLR